ncbi:MAG: LPS export ABC transporter periplasmic protein LptC [Candidatus Bruticola sp.]
MVNIRLCLAALAAACSLSFYCLSPAAADPSRESVPLGKQSVTLNSDRGDYSEKEKLVRLIGNVKFTCRDAVMTSSFAKYHTDTQVADFQGNIKLYQPGTSVSGRAMRVYYADQKAVLKGGVKVVSTKFRLKNSSDESTAELGAAEPAYLEADEFEYSWAQGIGYAKGAIRFIQGKRRVFADKAKYDRNSAAVELFGNVRLEDDESDWLSCERVRVNLSTNQVEAAGRVVGSFLIESENLSSDSNSQKSAIAQPKMIEPDSGALSPQPAEQIDPLDYPNL